ncbi:MAG: four helix bundle protein [bacterium]
MRDHTKLRAFEIAFASLRELHCQFNLARRLGYLKAHDLSKHEAKIVETEKVLAALIRSLR